MKTLSDRRWLTFLFVLFLSGPLARAQAPGPGSALNLDGASGYVQVPNGVWFSNDFTIEAWVFVRSYNSWSRLIDFADGPSTNNVYLALSDGGTGLPAMGVFTNNNGTPVLDATNQLPLNQWVHLAATLNGVVGTIYINGIPSGSAILNRPPNVLRTNNFIGHSNYAPDGNANALFDELRIWNVAHSQSQIQANMHRSLVGNEAGLVGYWRMDDAAGTNLTDSTINAQNGILIGGSTWTNSGAPIIAGPGSAVNFNAASNQLGSIPNRSAFNAYPLTVMTWFKTPATNMGSALVNKYSASVSNGYQIFMAGGHLQAFYIRDVNNNVFNAGGAMDAGAVNDGLWHHAALTVDATGGKLYLDGVQKAARVWSGTAGPPTTSLGISLGIYQGNSFWTGQLDDVSIWNTALSASQIQAAMNYSLIGTEPGLVGYWRLDEGSGTNIADATTNAFNGTLVNNPTWVTSGARLAVPNPGYGLSLSGTNAYIQVPPGIWFSTTFTIESWVYTRSYNFWSRVMDFANSAGEQEVYFALSDGTSGLPTMGVFNTSGTPTVGSTNQLPLNQWAHLAATFDGTNGAIYINGVLSGIGPISDIPVGVTRTNNFIGRSNFGGDTYANAIFDEFRIWNTAHTQVQIQETMNRTLAGNEPGLVGYWRFDDGVGTNATDAMGNGNNATLINGPVWTISKAPASGAPVLTSQAASNVTASSATLRATVQPNGFSTTVWFAYGTNQNYGATNVIPNIGSGVDPVLVTNNISGLTKGLAYHFRVSASNSFGLTIGVDQTLTALDPPIVTTLPATGVTATNVTLNGTVNPNGTAATVWFQYGLTTNYDSATPTTSISATNTNAVPVSNIVGNLYPGLTYHFRLVGTNLGTTGAGADLTFTPPAVAPTIGGQFASGIAPTSVVLNAQVTANGADTTAFFQYGLTTNYGSVTPSTNVSGTNLAAVPVSNLISNLQVGAVYHFQLVATNLAGSASGGDQAVVTPAFLGDATPMPGVRSSAAVWGDYDNDGRLDILISGIDVGNNQLTQVWRNTGSGFTNINAGLPGVYFSSVAWGDYDNDGRIDILLSGLDAGNNPLTQVWRNTGNGFTNINAGLPGIQGSVAWGDYDKDGRLDILLSGEGLSGPITQVWRNTGSGFTNINAGLTVATSGSVAWGDYDNDGRLDILLSGSGFSGAPVTEIWRNTGSGFTNINAGLPGVYYSSVAWGDYDNDGRLDVLLSGYDAGNNLITQVWRNTGNGFTNINAGLPGMSGAAVWGDYDSDGRLDILLSGIDGGNNPITQVWRNTISGFTLIQSLPGAYIGSVSWGDYNRDGRLDILLTGNGPGFTPYTQLFVSQASATNSTPAAPSGLSTVASTSAVTLNWNTASDLQTPSAGLSYNVRIGTTPGGSDFMRPMSATNGTLLAPQRGNLQTPQLALSLSSLPPAGTKLYWSVQSVDTSFAGSPFAAESSFTVRPFFTSWGRGTDGTFHAQFSVQGGTNYVIQGSTDLVHWQDLFDFTFGSSGPVLFTDPASTNYPQRFYRFGQH